MSTDRNTHFVGFAKKALKDLDVSSSAFERSSEIVTDKMIYDTFVLVIAQNAYDLVEHIMDTAYAHDMCTTMDEIPDMPVLPDEAKQ